MKNPLIVERLRFYREQNNLTVKQVSEILSETLPVADKTIYGWGKRPYPTGCGYTSASLLYL